MKATKFTAVTPLHKPRYGTWAGNPRGQSPDPALCCEEILPPGRGMIFQQCGKVRGHGPEGAYCFTHDPARREAKAAAAQAAYDAKWAGERRRVALQAFAPKMLEALQAIADGHNDPRTLAAATIAAMPA